MAAASSLFSSIMETHFLPSRLLHSNGEDWRRRARPLKATRKKKANELKFSARHCGGFKPFVNSGDGLLRLFCFILFNSLYTFWAVLFFTSFSSFEFSSHFFISYVPAAISFNLFFLFFPLVFAFRLMLLNWCANTTSRASGELESCKLEKSLKFSANFHIFHLTTHQLSFKFDEIFLLFISLLACLLFTVAQTWFLTVGKL